MTPEQIAAARALVDAATPGPWRLGLKWDSVVADGSTGYDDQDTIDAYGGHLVCESAKLGPNARFVAWCRDGVPALLDALAAAEARAADLTAKLEAMTDRKGFPILGQRGVYVDWQLVADHGGQANTNHGQTVARLAERGGLSWCELFAVLHNQRWQKMDSNDAMIACRELEARYLAALNAGGAA